MLDRDNHLSDDSSFCTIMRYDLHVLLANRPLFAFIAFFMLHIELSHRSQYTEIFEATPN